MATRYTRCAEHAAAHAVKQHHERPATDNRTLGQAAPSKARSERQKLTCVMRLH